MRRQQFRVASVQIERFNIVETVSISNVSGRAWLRISQLHTIVVAFGEETRNQRTNFSGAEYQYVLHAYSPKKTACVRRECGAHCAHVVPRFPQLCHPMKREKCRNNNDFENRVGDALKFPEKACINR